MSESKELLEAVRHLVNTHLHLSEKHMRLLEFVKDKSLLLLSDDKISSSIMRERDNCDYYLAQECRDLLKEIGELE